MSDAKLQKINLGKDWLDLSYGEPISVQQELLKQINKYNNSLKMPSVSDLKDWTYQPAAGKPDLIKILEDKYDAKVVVSNGAKQALAASLYSFKKSNVNSIFFESPFYPANTSIIDSVGLVRVERGSEDCRLITSPNNPDGRYVSSIEILQSKFRVPTIHDAAYYTDIYLPDGEIPMSIADIQVYSMSKMYGLSGLRIGYSVVHNEKYYKDMVDYMEMTTAGVSTASQDIARNLELFFKEFPQALTDFNRNSRTSLILSREVLKNIDSDVLIPEKPESNSMFAWCKVGSKLDYQAAKVYMLPGELFGKPGYMRLNIAYPVSVISEAVSRLNKHKKV